MFDIDKKVIVVTGGAGLLGRSFCEEILRNQGICIIADFNIDNGKQVLMGLQTQFPESESYFYFLDINSKESIALLIENLHSRFGRIDAVVNNAYPRNKHYGRHYFEVEHSDFCENIDSHLGGYFLMCQQFAKYFINQGRGNIVNISSVYGVIAPRFEIYDETNMTMPVEYAVIKSALLHLTKYTAKYLKGKNIRVNAISLGGIINNQPEAFVKSYNEQCLNKGMLLPGDVVGALLFLLSDQSLFVNGQNIIVDDGFSL